METLHGTAASARVTGLSDLKVTVKSLLAPGCRWPIVGENFTCGWSGHWNLTLSVLEWFVIVKLRVRGSLMKQSPNRIRFGLAAALYKYKMVRQA